jgi:hypothetical protein
MERKEKEKPGSGEKKIIAQRKALKQETVCLVKDQVDQILDLVDVQHNCGLS